MSFFGPENTGFEMFGIWHFIGLLIYFFIPLFLILVFGDSLKNKSYEKYIRYAVVVFFFFFEIGILYWKGANLEGGFINSIPLHICSFTLFLSLYTLVTLNRKSTELVFYLLTGSVLSIILPSTITSTITNFRYHAMFGNHGFHILTVIYMCKVHDIRLRRSSYISTIKFVLPIILIAYIVNLTLGTEFIFLMEPPVKNVILDFFYGISGYAYTAFWIFITILPMFILSSLWFVENDTLMKEVKSEKPSY